MTSTSLTWPCVALREEPLASRTTMRIGGRAEWLLEPATPEELREAWCAARDRGLPVRILGGGANLVIEEGLHRGVILTTERLRRIFRPTAREGEGGVAGFGPDGSEALTDQLPPSAMAPPPPAENPVLVAWAGATLPSLVRAARDLGYSGLEGIVGVPGHVGGGVAMNAGGRWGSMWDVIESVHVLDTTGELRVLPRSECTPRYRDGGLGEAIVLGAVLRFEPRPRPEIEERMRQYLTEKRAVQPVTEWSAGCVFKNPDPEESEGRSAGKLIDDCGGKELRRGDAIVSPLHGNFIVNTGTASAAEVTGLMADVRDHVAQRSGVHLEYEVKRWLRDDAPEGRTEKT